MSADFYTEIDKNMSRTVSPPEVLPEKRSTLGEIWSQLKAGAFSDFPRMAGKAMQYVSAPGQPVYETGKGLAEDAAAIATLPEMQPSAASDGTITGALAKGARMIPQSVAPAVGAGLLLSGVGAPAGVALIGGSALAAAPAGLAQAQETYEKGLARHGLTPEQAATLPDDPRVIEAQKAGRITGAIEWGGETAGGALAGRFMGIGGGMAKSAIGKLLNKGEQTAAQATLKSFTNPGTIGRFAGNALETAGAETLTEMGQGAGEAAVEQHYGYDRQTPWQAAQDAIAPTLGMSALLLPFGIPAHASHAVKMNAITSALQNPAIAPELRSNAAEIVYDELAKSSPVAADNFAAHAFDAIHGDQDTGSAPYGMTLDDNVLNPLTPRALDEQQNIPEGALTRAVSSGIPAAATTMPQPVLSEGATDMLNTAAPVDQATPEPTDFTSRQEPRGATMFSPQTGSLTESAAIDPPAQPAIIPTSSLHGTLQAFIKMGQERGQAVQVWDRPHKPRLDYAVAKYLQPAAEQGLVLQDQEGAYHVRTDKGNLRILPPTEDNGNYHVEYHSPAATDTLPVQAVADTIASTAPPQQAAPLPPAQIAEAHIPQINKGEVIINGANGLRYEYVGRDKDASGNPGLVVKRITENGTVSPTKSYLPISLQLFRETARSEQNTPEIQRQTVENAFPGQTISQTEDGYHVALKNGATIKVSPVGDIHFDTGVAEAAYGRKFSQHEKPVAEFRKLEHGAVIALTEQGTGQIHHETFHAAMAMALNGKQRAIIMTKFGTEEAAEAEYQRLRDNGAFERKRQHHLFLQTVYNFFAKIRTMLDPTREIMKDVASGKAWETTANTTDVTPTVKYSMADIRRNTENVAGHLNRIGDKSTFVKSDIKPALKTAGEGMAAAWDGIKAATAPMTRSAAAEEAGRILIEGMGRQEHGKEKFITGLNKATMQAGMTTTKTSRILDLMQSSVTLADKVFNRMAEADRIAFMQNLDIGQQQATPELQNIADTIKAMFEQKTRTIQDMGTGALENVRENYFPHIWKKGEDVAKEINTRLSKRPLEGSKAFSKARVFDDIMTGIDAGFELVSTNPIDLVMLKMGEMDKYINAHLALQAMENSGLVELVPAGDKMPDGYGDISGKYGLVTKRAHQDANSGQPGELKSFRYIAREDVAQVFNNYLSQNLYTNKYVGKPFSAYMKAANTLNQFQLGVFSAFHAGFTSLEAVVSHGALGIKALVRGDFSEAGKYFKHAPAAWYLNPKLGDKVLKAWMGDEAAAKEMPQVIEWLTMAGARRIMDSRFQTTTTQNMLQAWSDGNKIGAGARLIPSIVEQSARPIMEWLVPRQKLGVFTEMAHDWSNRHPNASHGETRAAMQQAWNRIDSRLGQVVYDRLFIHSVAKNLTQALIRAPGWTGGTILEVGGGLKDLITFTKDTASGKKPELSDRSAYTLSLLITTALANVLLTAMFTGEPPDDWKDLLAFRTGRKDEKGNPERFMLPTYAKDVYAYAMKPGTTLLHKSHPMISLVGDLIRNKDYYGVEIRHEGDNPIMQLAQAGKFTAKAFVPFWMKGAAKDLERGGNILTMTAPLIGIMPAPAALNQSKAEQLAGELVRDRMPQGTKTAEEFERSQLVQHLSGLARRDPQQARQEMQEALKERKITPLQARHVFTNTRLAPIQITFKRLSYDEAQRVYEVATNEEKKGLRMMLAQKRFRHIQAGG